MRLQHPTRDNSFYPDDTNCSVGKGGIFVFGSNLAGRHGRGAARTAMRQYGAIYRRGVGPMGSSYAIPTKGYRFDVLDICVISEYVKDFVACTHEYPDFHFLVTSVGTGLAGHPDSSMAPLFKGAINCWFTESWRPFI